MFWNLDCEKILKFDLDIEDVADLQFTPIWLISTV